MNPDCSKVAGVGEGGAEEDEEESLKGESNETESSVAVLNEVDFVHIMQEAAQASQDQPTPPSADQRADGSATPTVQPHQVVVFFFAPWCTVCRALKPIFLNASRLLKLAGVCHSASSATSSRYCYFYTNWQIKLIVAYIFSDKC